MADHADLHDRDRSDAPIDWEAVLVAHGSWLRGVIAIRVHDCHAVDDVLQEVAAAALQQRSRIEDREKLGAWLYRVAVRQSMRYRRKHARQRRHETIAARHRARAGEGDAEIPINWLLSTERRQMVHAALDRLPSRDAELLMLKYFEGWSYKQLAERFGVTEKTIDNRLHRARQWLRRVLAEMLDGDDYEQ